MKLSHPHQQEIEKKEKKAAEKRGEAKALTVLGAAGGATYLAAETCFLLDGVMFLDEVTNFGANTKHQNRWKTVGLVAATVGLGALIYAGIKYQHAHKLEEEKQRLAKDTSDWQSKLLSEKDAKNVPVR